MNCQNIKLIDIVLFLKKQGFEPTKTTHKTSWFLSPFRAEKTASFKVDTDRNIWFDFGEGCGGTIIDLVMKIEKCSIKDAIQKLSLKTFSIHQRPKSPIQKPKYRINTICELEHTKLISYLKDRNLDIDFAKRFCREVYYTFNKQKENYAIGFMNDLGGFEIRNKYFKGCLGKKAITCIKNNSIVLCVFESWSDFLSYLTLKKEIPFEDFIILNSTALIKNVIDLIPNYKEVKVFFDNDIAGDKAFSKLQNQSNFRLIDCRKHYQKFNDLNDFLIDRNKV